MEDEKKVKHLEVGPPIWVGSLLSVEEWKECTQKYATCILKEPPRYTKEKYEGGKWRG